MSSACTARTNWHRGATLIVVVAAACHIKSKASDDARAPQAAAPVTQSKSPPDPWVKTSPLSFDVDRSIDPCDDFDAFACNGWDATPEPGEEMRDVAFSRAARANEGYSHEVLERSRTSPGDDPLLRQLGTFYGSCMDEDAIERSGTTAFAPLLTAIADVHDPASLGAATAAMAWVGANPLFGFGPAPAAADVRRTIWVLSGLGLGLASETYGARDRAAREKLSKYEHGIASVLTGLGHDGRAAASEAHAIVVFETQLAAGYVGTETAHNEEVGRAGLVSVFPHFAWDTFLAAIDVHDPISVQIKSQHYFGVVDHLLGSTPWNVWRAYLAFHLVDGYRNALPRRFRSPDDTTARWRTCSERTWTRLYDVMGQVYVRDRFDAPRARTANALVAALSRAMKAELSNASWLDERTRAEAERKLAGIAWQVGEPSRWKRYDVALDRAEYAANLLALTRLQTSREYAAVGAPPDREERNFTVAITNARYVPHHNAIEIPAGIWQAPFFDTDAPVAINLGSIGMVIGHELTHAFDNQGAKFDADGSVRDWWQPATYAEFTRRTKCVIDEFDRYKTAAGPVNGALTVGENIADLGGLKLAFAAYRELRAPKSTVPSDGFTDDQLFFLSFAQTFCRKARLSWSRWALTHDAHAPSKTRINATVSAMPEFAAAFMCKPSAKLAPAEHCSVW
jgi:putative endopeptidase